MFINYTFHKKKFIAILPNLRYKKNDKNNDKNDDINSLILSFDKLLINNISNDIYFKPSKKIDDFIENGEKTDLGELLPIGHICLNGKIIFKNIEFTWDIKKKELPDGLEINVEYKDDSDIISLTTIEKKKIARCIEGLILGISLNEDYDDDEKFIDDNYYDNEIKYYSVEDDESSVPSNEIEDDVIDDTSIIDELEYNK